MNHPNEYSLSGKRTKLSPFTKQDASERRRYVPVQHPKQVMQLLQINRERNKFMAKRSRERKKEELTNLEQTLADIRAENSALRQQLAQYQHSVSPHDQLKHGSATLEFDRRLPNMLSELMGSLLDGTSPNQDDLTSDDSETITFRRSKEPPHSFPDYQNCLKSEHTASSMSMDEELTSLSPSSARVGSQTTMSNSGKNSTSPAVCLVNSLSDDFPVLFASAGFMALTGYRRDQIVGTNCGAFLQGPQTDLTEERVHRLHVAITEGHNVSSTLLNYRQDRSTFLNRVELVHLKDLRGRSVLITITLREVTIQSVLSQHLLLSEHNLSDSSDLHQQHQQHLYTGLRSQLLREPQTNSAHNTKRPFEEAVSSGSQDDGWNM